MPEPSLFMRAAKKSGPVAAKYWGKVLAAIATLACAFLASKTDAILAGRDKRDEDIVQLQQAVDGLLEKNAEQETEIAVLRTIIEERTRPAGPAAPVVTAAAPQPPRAKLPKTVGDVKVDEDKVRVYQNSRK